MQSNRQTNYWQPDPDEAKITEMYAPAADTEEPQASFEPTNTVNEDEIIRWSAAEYMHQEKNGLWFMMFALVVLALIAVDILLFQSYTFSVLVVVMAVAVVIYSHRPPKIINYSLSINQGLYIDETLRHFSEFKSFGVINDNSQNSIILIPTKRFSPSVSFYFPDDLGETIVDILGARLPMGVVKRDLIDIIVHKLQL